MLINLSYIPVESEISPVEKNCRVDAEIEKAFEADTDTRVSSDSCHAMSIVGRRAI